MRHTHRKNRQAERGRKVITLDKCSHGLDCKETDGQLNCLFVVFVLNAYCVNAGKKERGKKRRDEGHCFSCCCWRSTSVIDLSIRVYLNNTYFFHTAYC